MATTLLHPFLYPRRLRHETEWFSHTLRDLVVELLADLRATKG